MSGEPQRRNASSSSVDDSSAIPTIQILPKVQEDDDFDVSIRTSNHHHSSFTTPLTSPTSPSMSSSTLSTPTSSSETYHPSLILHSEVPLSHMRVVRNREEILSPCISHARNHHNLLGSSSSSSGLNGLLGAASGAFGSSTSLDGAGGDETPSPTDIMSYNIVQPTTTKVVLESTSQPPNNNNDTTTTTILSNNTTNNNNNTISNGTTTTTSLKEAAEELIHTLENSTAPLSLETVITTFIEQESTRRRSTVDKEDIAILQEIAANHHLHHTTATAAATTIMEQQQKIETLSKVGSFHQPISVSEANNNHRRLSDAVVDALLVRNHEEEVDNNTATTSNSDSNSNSSSSSTLETTNKPHRFMQKRPSFINPELMSMLFSSLLSLQDLKPSDNQVAGHGQKDGEEHLVVRHLRDKIYKPINTKSKRAFDEVKFYEQQATRIPLLAPFLPKYHGVQTVKENDQQFLVLEDLTAPFTNPSLLDIRMGRRVYGDDASLEKIKMFEEKYIYQKELGFGFSGMKVYNTDSEFSKTNKNRHISHKDQKYKVYDRYWGRNCKPHEESNEALDSFFFDTSYVESEAVGIKTVQSILSQLKQLEELFKTHQLIFRIYSSSLFLVFDADKAIVRMIDFAHVHENKEPTIDDNYLYGLSNLINYIEEVLRLHNNKNVP